MSNSSRDNRVPRRRAVEQSGSRPDVDATPSPPPRYRAAAPAVSLLGHLNVILHHSLGLFGTLLGLLKVPLAIAGFVLLSLHLYQQVAEVAIQTTCGIPGASLLPMCKPIVPKVHPLFAKVMEQEHAVAQMQKTASDNAALPYKLLSGQSNIKDLIFQISAADLPSKKRLMPKVNVYNTLLEQVVDAIQDAQLRTDTLVDNTISTYNWAEDQLEQIHIQRSSLMAPLRDLAIRTGLPLTKFSDVQVMQETFFGYTSRLQNDADLVIIQYQKTRGYIVKFRDFLDNLALDLKEEEVILDKKRLNDASYWKWLLRSHRQKMKGYNENMELCAKFYRHLMDSEKVIEITLFKMQEMRGRVRGMRDELAKAPLQLQGGAKPDLKLTIDAIKSAAAYLVDARTISNKRREQQMIDFENSMSQS